jgi:hypothetical protein
MGFEYKILQHIIKDFEDRVKVSKDGLKLKV